MPKTTVRTETIFRIVVEKTNHKKPWFIAYYDDMNAFSVRLHKCGIGGSADEAIQKLLAEYPRKDNQNAQKCAVSDGVGLR